MTILDPVTGAACAGGACGVTGGGLITGHFGFGSGALTIRCWISTDGFRFGGRFGLWT